MDLGLKGLRAVLAGASKGIGRATADILAAEGCHVAVCARSQEEVAGTVESLKAKGVRATGEAVDMANAQAYQSWIARAAESLGGCDIFIPFASVGGGPASEESWKATFDVDLLGVFRGVQAALPFLEKSKTASVVAIGTCAAVEDFAGPQAYNAMKAAVINYAHALALDLAPKGIRVNTVSPGPTYIKGGSWDWIEHNMPDFYKMSLGKSAVGRLGTAEEVGRAIAFVASPACPYMIGTNIMIDGGFTKRVQF